MPTTDPLGMLGLARRAGQVVEGTDAVRRALRDGRVHLVLLARDAAAGQVSKLEGLLKAGDVPVRSVADRGRLGGALGAGPLSAVGVTGERFALRLLEVLDAEARGGSLRSSKDDRTYAG